MTGKKFSSIEFPVEIIRRQPLVLFDAECVLCSRTVRFLLRHNPGYNLSFASLQSETGSLVKELAGYEKNNFDTVILVKDNTVFFNSDAAIEIAAFLTFPWRLFGVFKIVPSPLRNACYRYIVKNRFKWFGRKTFCPADFRNYEHRFLT